MVGAALGPTLPGLAGHTGSSVQQISYLFTACSLGYLIGSFGGGRLYDHLPGHRLMASGRALPDDNLLVIKSGLQTYNRHARS